MTSLLLELEAIATAEVAHTCSPDCPWLGVDDDHDGGR